MINVTFCCAECGAAHQIQCGDNAERASSDAVEFECSACRHRFRFADRAIVAGRVRSCLVCPSVELYVRKDFSQRWGVGIVVTGLLASSIAWFFRHFYITYGILFLTALIDAMLYLIRGNVLQCYRCQAEYRGIRDLEGQEPFHLETHEKYRQQAARMSQAGSPAAPSSH